MHRKLATFILSLAIAAIPLPSLADSPALPPATQSTAIPIKLIVLYSSGVGYFQHAGIVHDNASTELRFKTDQINDILKSLVLQDLDHGSISDITYPSQDPIDKTLASFQINLAENPSLHDLLNQLRGSKVSLDLGTEKKVAGTILGVEMKPRPTKDDDKKVIELPVLNLLAEDSIQSIDFDQIRSVHLEDPELQSELTQALAALAQSRDKDKKPVVIHFAGQGDRHVSIGYVVETPVWKTSYRLVLPADSKSKPQLQGWALVENQTDSDWSHIQLSLVSGRPISFIQDLYQPLYIPRPVVKPELYASLTPQTYDSGVDLTKNIETRLGLRQKSESAADAVAATPMMQPAGQIMAGKALADRRAYDKDSLAYYSQLNITNSISSAASTSKLGELFQYTLTDISLPRQKSAMLPIVTDPIDAARVSIYNAAVLEKYPLNGALLKNTTKKHLLGGPITVFDHDAYAGDARIDDLPPDQTRLLSFGVDLQLRVNAKSDNQSSTITAGKIVKGVLQVTRKHHASQTYTAQNHADHDKTLIIEYPITDGWKLVSTPDPMEKTESLYRFKIPVKANDSATFTVQTEHVDSQTIAILPTDIGQLQFYAQSGQISKHVRDALSKAIDLKQALVDTDRDIHDKEARITATTEEQNRIRENMKVVDRQSAYYKRLVSKLNDQETQLDNLRNDLDALHETLSARRTELESYLNSISTD